jgi:hypothetical protein
LHHLKTTMKTIIPCHGYRVKTAGKPPVDRSVNRHG